MISKFGSLNNRGVITGRAIAFILLIMGTGASPAMAFGLGPWVTALIDFHALIDSLIDLIVCYVLAIGIAAIAVRAVFPPAGARLSCWIAAMIWIALQVFYVFPRVMHVIFPIWFIAGALVLGVLFGVVLAATAPRATEAQR